MLAKAQEHLAHKDPKLRPLLANITLESLEPRHSNIYEALLRSITYQQLSGKAAATIFGRFLALFGENGPEAATLAAMDIEALRAVGLSKQKATYLQNVARFHLEHNIGEGRDWSGWTDEDLTKLLCGIKGVGVWTVQMILMFQLGRPDVFPVGDLGIQQGMASLYGIEYANEKELKSKMTDIAKQWRPYRSIASRYIWRYKDGDQVFDM
jgi:DNA-3-methyladenine glycosylase II